MKVLWLFEDRYQEHLRTQGKRSYYHKQHLSIKILSHPSCSLGCQLSRFWSMTHIFSLSHNHTLLKEFSGQNHLTAAAANILTSSWLNRANVGYVDYVAPCKLSLYKLDS